MTGSMVPVAFGNPFASFAMPLRDLGPLLALSSGHEISALR
jgi:hypothetical protein